MTNIPKRVADRLIAGIKKFQPILLAARLRDVVVVMPEVEPRNHHPVVAKLKSDGVVLKILNLIGRDGRTIRLSSINPVYEPTDYTLDDFHWIYPVHSSQRMHWR